MKIEIYNCFKHQYEKRTVEKMFLWDKMLFAIVNEGIRYSKGVKLKPYVVYHVLTGKDCAYTMKPSAEEAILQLKGEDEMNPITLKEFIQGYLKNGVIEKIINCNEKVLRYARKNVNSWAQSVREKMQ